MKKSDMPPLRIWILCMLSVVLVTASFSGCAGTVAPTSATSGQPHGTTTIPTTTPAIDEDLVGYWTNNPDRLKVSLDDQGKPLQTVPIGEWYVFDQEGRYYRFARFMTFAIGGTQVEEGFYEAKSGVIRLYDRTESFFPDEGSPQKAKYREALTADETFFYKMEIEQSNDAIYLKTSLASDAVLFWRCAN